MKLITKITKYLYLGDRHYTVGDLRVNGIDYVVSLSRHPTGLEHRQIPLKDGEGNDPRDYIYALHKIQKHTRSSERVLVHCDAGLSRSVFISILYLMLCCGKTRTEALNILKGKRGLHYLVQEFRDYIERLGR